MRAQANADGSPVPHGEQAGAKGHPHETKLPIDRDFFLGEPFRDPAPSAPDRQHRADEQQQQKQSKRIPDRVAAAQYRNRQLVHPVPGPSLRQIPNGNHPCAADAGQHSTGQRVRYEDAGTAGILRNTLVAPGNEFLADFPVFLSEQPRDRRKIARVSP